MKKRILSALLGFMLITISISGCSGSTSNTEPLKEYNDASGSLLTETPTDLVLEDSNYTILSSGYVLFTLCIKNENKDIKADYAQIKITGKKKDGSIDFSDDWTIGGIMPQTTSYWASQAGDGTVDESDAIEISVSVNKDDWVRTSATVPDDLYVFSNVTVIPDDVIKITGEVTLKDDSLESEFNNLYSPMLICVLKDDKGKIVGGFNAFLNSELKPGEPYVFDVRSYSAFGDFAKADLYANPW